SASIPSLHDALPICGGHEQMADEIFLARAHADAPLTAPALISVAGDRRPLDVAGVAHRDRHVFFGDQVFDAQFPRGFDDFGAMIDRKSTRLNSSHT